ncbi:MAG: PAS domain-containing protein, partial [Proteobacteria bacterium]|nr:PAS domain-containing protein [Pseudomonadota bacterium]
MAETKKNRESITLSLAFPLAVALMLSLAASLYGMHWVQQQNTKQRLYDEAFRGQEVFRSLLETETKQLQMRIEIYQANPELQEAFLSRDQSRILKILGRLGLKVSEIGGMGQLFLVDAEMKLVFSSDSRMPPGKVLTQQMIRQAAGSHKMAHGLELDREGRLFLRVVVPWVVTGGETGYVEMGQDISLFVPKLKEILGYEIFITAQKTGIDFKQWDAGAAAGRKAGSWQELKECVVLARTMTAPPAVLCEALMGGSTQGFIRTLDFTEGERHFRGGFVDLLNPAQVHLGTLVMLQDVTSEVVSLWAMALYLGGVGLAIALMFFLFFYLYISRLDRKLATNQAHLRETIADRDIALSQTSTMLQRDIARREEVEREFQRICRQNQLVLDSIGEGIFGLDSKGNHTFVNPQAARMLGYELEELVGQPSHALWHHSRRDGTHFSGKECPIYQTICDGKVH